MQCSNGTAQPWLFIAMWDESLRSSPATFPNKAICIALHEQVVKFYHLSTVVKPKVVACKMLHAHNTCMPEHPSSACIALDCGAYALQTNILNKLDWDMDTPGFESSS